MVWWDSYVLVELDRRVDSKLSELDILKKEHMAYWSLNQIMDYGKPISLVTPELDYGLW